MTNREKFKDELDEMLSVFLAVVEGKPVPCEDTYCQECDFRGKCNEREDRVIDWLNAEYKEPSVDWSKVPIDTPVLAQDIMGTWHRMYLAGCTADTKRPFVFENGRTSWSADGYTWIPQKVKLVEGTDV